MSKILFWILVCIPYFGWAQNYSALVFSDIHLSLDWDQDARRNCDADTSLFQSALKVASGKYKYILLPGDLMQHGNTHDTNSLRKTFTYIFSHLHQIDPNAIIIPSLGNNDCLNHNEPDNTTFRIFYDCLLKCLDKDGTISNDFLTGGYYQYTSGGLSFLSLNTVLFRNNSDFNTLELDWLEQRLVQDSANKQDVWIVYHIPPGTDSDRVRHVPTQRWDPALEQRYAQLMRRFAPIIKYQQAGHLHMDDDKLIMQSGRLSSYIHISPGLNWRNGNNPAFQVLHADKNLDTVKDIITHYSDTSGHHWDSYSFHDFSFGFFIHFNTQSKEGNEFMRHLTTNRPDKTHQHGIPSWNEVFAKRSEIGNR